MKSIHIALVLAAVLPFASACDKGAGSADGASTAATAAGTAGEGKADDGKADGAKLEAAYEATFGDMKSTKSFDEKLADLKAKIGEPHKTEEKNLFWWGWNEKGKHCREIKIMMSAGGMMGITDKAKCGK